MSKTPSLREALEQINKVATDAPELNLSNFDTDQVAALNEAMTEIYGIVDTALSGSGDGWRPTTHTFRPNRKYPWFCADCGYPEHERLQHPAPPKEDDKPCSH